jgi:hypothetical protein
MADLALPAAKPEPIAKRLTTMQPRPVQAVNPD